MDLKTAVRRLARRYGPAASPPAEPFELVLAENVAYLADDARRAAAMAILRDTVGTTPAEIARATPARLRKATALGILPATSATKLTRAARVAIDGFGGDLRAVLDLPVAEAKRALRTFPGIGEPGAEKLLLVYGRAAFLAPDSNALRVIERLGLVPAGLRYAQTYRAAREVAARAFGDDIPRLVRARHVLRAHGQQVCRTTRPACGSCPLAADCPSVVR